MCIIIQNILEFGRKNCIQFKLFAAIEAKRWNCGTVIKIFLESMIRLITKYKLVTFKNWKYRLYLNNPIRLKSTYFLRFIYTDNCLVRFSLQKRNDVVLREA